MHVGVQVDPSLHVQQSWVETTHYNNGWNFLRYFGLKLLLFRNGAMMASFIVSGIPPSDGELPFAIRVSILVRCDQGSP